MPTEPELVELMKQEVGRVAASRVKSNSIVGLGTWSTTAFAIRFLGERLKSGELKNIRGIPTSFQAAALARHYGIPLTTLDDMETIDIAIAAVQVYFFWRRGWFKKVSPRRRNL